MAKLSVDLPGKSPKVYWETDGARQGSPVTHDWGRFARKYPDGTTLCTGWKWTKSLACATVHN